MKLTRICAQNFKGFPEINLDLNGRSTVLFGVNGVGKSSILALINYLFRPLCNRLNPSQGTTFSALSDELIHLGQSEMEINIDVAMDKNEFHLRRTHRKTRPGQRKRTISLQKQTEYVSFADEIRMKADEEANIPIFVHYGTNRSVLQIPLRIRSKHIFTQFSALERSVENAIDFKTFFEWFRNEEDMENEYIRDHGDSSYRDRALECVRRTTEAMLDNVSGLRIKRYPLRMVVEKEGKELMIDYLSDGEKCTLALFGDLSRRLAIANPKLENPMEGNGIVLIDEIELHMHPSWQRKVLPTLRNCFPNIQFIITTHSPQVLGELSDEYQIYHIEKLDDRQSISLTHRLDGFDSNYILEKFMETSSVNVGFQKKLENAYSLIDENRFQEAERAIEEITQITEQNHTEVIRLEGALKRGKYLYEKHQKG